MRKINKSLQIIVIISFTVLIISSVWRIHFREGMDVKQECIDDELNKGKYKSDLQMFTNYGDENQIEQCKELTKGEMFSRWEEETNKNKYKSCDHYSDEWYDKNRRIIQKECGQHFLLKPKSIDTDTPESINTLESNNTLKSSDISESNNISNDISDDNANNMIELMKKNKFK